VTGSSAQATTNSSGAYTVTPSRSGYTFTPTSQSKTVNSANVTLVNFTATAVQSGFTGNFLS
jgi:hypothetical protein